MMGSYSLSTRYRGAIAPLILSLVILTTLASSTQAADYYFTTAGKTFASLTDCLNSQDPCDNSDYMSTYEFPPDSIAHHDQTSLSFFMTNSTGRLVHQFQNVLAASISIKLTAFPGIVKDAIVSQTFYYQPGDDSILSNFTALAGTSWQTGGASSQLNLRIQDSTFYAAMPRFFVSVPSITITDTIIYDTSEMRFGVPVGNLTLERVRTLPYGGSSQLINVTPKNLIIRDCVFELVTNSAPVFLEVQHGLIENSTFSSSDGYIPIVMTDESAVVKKDAREIFGARGSRQAVVEKSTFIIRGSSFIDAGFEGLNIFSPLPFNIINISDSLFNNSQLYLYPDDSVEIVNCTITAWLTYPRSTLVYLASPYVYMHGNRFPTVPFNAGATRTLQFGHGPAPFVLETQLVGDFAVMDLTMAPNTGLYSILATGNFSFATAYSYAGNGYSVWNTTGEGSALELPNNVSFPDAGLIVMCSNGGKFRLNHQFPGQQMTVSNDVALVFQPGELEYVIPRPTRVEVGDFFEILSSINANSLFPSIHSSPHSLGYEGDFSNSTGALTFSVTAVICHPPCLNGGSCVARDNCSCPSTWGGPTCECTTIGQIGSTECNPDGTQSWVVENDLIMNEADHLDIPAGYNVFIQGTLTNNGNITIRTGTTLQTGAFNNLGLLELEGGITQNLRRDGEPCKTSASITVSNFTLPSTGRMYLKIDASLIDPESSCAKELTAPIVKSNSTSQLDGKIDIAVAGSSSTRASISVVSSRDIQGSNSGTTLAVSSTTPQGTCATTESKSGIISLFVNPCTAEATKGKKSIPWYYWGAPVIAVVGIAIIIAVLGVSVPSIRNKVLPYKGS
jgi:hypothetical protein